MLQTLRIENFKSLRDVTLKLQPVNLLIGPNNAGKSNILEALQMFAQLVHSGSKSNGNNGSLPKLDERYLWGKPILDASTLIQGIYPEPIVFSGEVHLQGKNQDQDPDWHYVCKRNPSASWLITRTALYLSVYGDVGYIDFYGVGKKQVSLSEIKNFPVLWQELEAEFLECASVSTLNADTFDAKAECIIKTDSGIRHQEYSGRFDSAERFQIMQPALLGYQSSTLGATIYKTDVNKLKQPYPITGEAAKVLPDCSNLVAFLDRIFDEEDGVRRSIENDLRLCVPNFSGLILQKVEIYDTHPQKRIFPTHSVFKRLGLVDVNAKKIAADELSEGTLYFLALLAIIHQPNPPKLLMLEQLEDGIHPRRIREVMELIFALAERKHIQIILTTHSPIVVDHFSEIPDAVHVAEMQDGATTVKNLQQDIINPLDTKFKSQQLEPIPFTDSLGEYWVTGFFGGVPR